MSRKIGKRMNDGNLTGLKQDKFRNSKYEYEQDQYPARPGGVTRRTANTLGGIQAENRGRRSASKNQSRIDNPFENGRLYNWNHRRGWDEYYQESGNRSVGGSIRNHDIAHRGKGPKGYARSDEKIYEDVCESLSSSRDVDASEIEVSVKEGVIYLKGTVDSRYTKRLAEYEVENISGVKDVQNLLSFLNVKREDSSKKNNFSNESQHSH